MHFRCAWLAIGVILLFARVASSYEVSAGYNYSCAIDDAGAHCWGFVGDGQTTVPAGLSNPIDISAGEYRTCAIDDSGASCWGYGVRPVPPGLTNPTAIAAGYSHQCVIDDNGVTCWGWNDLGQITVPAGIVNPREITAGYNHNCVIDDSGVVCWGDGGPGYWDPPPGLINPRHISAGRQHNCVIDDNGVVCWGIDTWGQVSVPPGLVNPKKVAAGHRHTCAIDDNGVTCWGDFPAVPVPSELVNPVAISAGWYHTCALGENGIACWGLDNYGQSTVPAELTYSLFSYVPSSGPPSQPSYHCESGTVPPTPPGVDGLVLVTHGWTPLGGDPTWPDTMAYEIGLRLSENGNANQWVVVACHWPSDSDGIAPHGAARRAEQLGERLGSYLVGQNYSRFHLIGHSAGSWLIEAAAEKLESIPGATIHTTFLDSYAPTVLAGPTAPALGDSSTWSEQYVDFFPLPDPNEAFWVDMTDHELPNAYNLNLTGLSSSANAGERHAWPHQWYLQTVMAPLSAATEGWGFIRSQEMGNLPNHTQYPRGETLQIGTQLRRASNLVATVYESILLIPELSSGVFCYVANGLCLQTSSPSWVVMNVDSDAPFNAILFDFEFVTQAEGWFSVEFDGSQLFVSDERHAPGGVNSKIVALDSEYPAGTHPLALRLDSYSAAQSEIRVTNVRFGLVESANDVPMLSQSWPLGLGLLVAGFVSLWYFGEAGSDESRSIRVRMSRSRGKYPGPTKSG